MDQGGPRLGRFARPHITPAAFGNP